MNEIKILVSCEYSGAVRDQFIKRGFNAVSCDILPTEAPGPHYQGSVLDIIADGWDVLVSFPPCTDLAVSGARHFEQKRKDGRQQKSIEFFMQMANAPIKHIAIENPVGIMSSHYRKPDQIIQPYYFGDPEQKTTCLWLKNLPPLFHNAQPDLFNESATHVKPEFITAANGKKYSRIHWLGGGSGHARSLTYKGVAEAMAEQWGNYLKYKYA